MERCVHKHLCNYIVEDIYSMVLLQASLLLITPVILVEKGIRVVFCDISKAFDTVWHKGLLHKRSHIGNSRNLLQLFKRRHRVVLNVVT